MSTRLYLEKSDKDEKDVGAIRKLIRDIPQKEKDKIRKELEEEAVDIVTYTNNVVYYRMQPQQFQPYQHLALTNGNWYLDDSQAKKIEEEVQDVKFE